MIDYEYFHLFKQDSVDKQIVISYDGGTITNSEIHSEQFELTESICSDQELRFGSCEANVLKFTYSTSSLISLNEKWIDVKSIIGGNENNPFKIGKFKVKSDVPKSDRNYHDIIAYDAMYDIINTDVTEWFNGLKFPMTLKQFRDSFFDMLGIFQENITLVNDDLVLNKSIQTDKISGKTVICSICEANGCFGNINRDGNFRYIYLTEIVSGLLPGNNLYPRNDLYPRDYTSHQVGNGTYIYCDYEEYKTQEISGLFISSAEDSAGMQIGSADNSYKITNNFLLNGLSDEQLRVVGNKIFDKIKVVSYIPVTNSECMGNPCLEVGDAIRFNTSKKLVDTYILSRTLTGIQSLKDKYYANGAYKISGNINSVYDEIKDLKGKTNVLERTAEETKSTISNLEENVSSEFRQTAQQISAEVSRAKSAEESLSTRVSLTEQGLTSTVKKGEVASEINQTSDTISFKANNIEIDSTYFKLTKTGNITAEAGNIGKFNITSNGLESQDGSTKLWYNTVYTGNVRSSGNGNISVTADNNLSLYGKNSVSISDSNGTVNIYGDVSINGYEPITTSNIGTQSVQYATNSNSANSATNSTNAYTLKSANDSYSTSHKSDNKLSSNATSGTTQLGSASLMWSEVFASKGSINTSDRNKKRDIREISEKYEKFFEMLIPVSFQFIDGDRTHIGFISQDVEDAMNECGLTSLDFAGFCKDIKTEYYIDENGKENVRNVLDEDGNPIYIYSLRYSEFIALNTMMIQKLDNKIDELQRKYELLENKINQLING